MTAGRSAVDAAAVRRRLLLAAEAPTLAYQVSDGDGEVTDLAGGDVDLGRLLDAADAAVGRLGQVPAAMIHPDGLAGALGRLRRVRNRLEAVEMSWLSQVRNREVHRDQGASSASKWAAERLGGSQRDASDRLRTADRLVDLPDTARGVHRRAHHPRGCLGDRPGDAGPAAGRRRRRRAAAAGGGP